MRLMLIGQKWLGAEALAMCLARGHDVAAVSVPDGEDRAGRLAAGHGIPVRRARRVEACDVPPGVDLLVCAHAHAYVTPGARAAARLGAIGYHPSLLPRHRGRDAIRWAVHMRETVTGGTVYWLDDGADTGPIAAQDWCWIRPGDTAEALWRRDLGPMGLRLLAGVLDRIGAGEVPARPQDAGPATWEPAFTQGARLSGA